MLSLVRLHWARHVSSLQEAAGSGAIKHSPPSTGVHATSPACLLSHCNISLPAPPESAQGFEQSPEGFHRNSSASGSSKRQRLVTSASFRSSSLNFLKLAIFCPSYGMVTETPSQRREGTLSPHTGQSSSAVQTLLAGIKLSVRAQYKSQQLAGVQSLFFLSKAGVMSTCVSIFLQWHSLPSCVASKANENALPLVDALQAISWHGTLHRVDVVDGGMAAVQVRPEPGGPSMWHCLCLSFDGSFSIAKSADLSAERTRWEEPFTSANLPA